jgi:hypothetical protein
MYRIKVGSRQKGELSPVKVAALCLERLEGQVFASQGAGKGSCCRLPTRSQESGREKARR